MAIGLLWLKGQTDKLKPSISGIQLKKLVQFLPQRIPYRVLPNHPVVVFILLFKQEQMPLLLHWHWFSVALVQFAAFKYRALGFSAFSHYLWHFEGLMIAEKLFPNISVSHYGRESSANRNSHMVSLRVDCSWSVSVIFDIKCYLA